MESHAHARENVGIAASIEVNQEKIAKAYRVPYWVVVGRPKPSWLERLIWRARAIWWRWT